jgi:hypothetical protein
MARPFRCPKCGSHDYAIVLTGCNLTNATLEEMLTWDEEQQDYVSGGSVVVDSEGMENEGATAVCAECEEDVTEAVRQYEASQEPATEA